MIQIKRNKMNNRRAYFDGTHMEYFKKIRRKKLGHNTGSLIKKKSGERNSYSRCFTELFSVLFLFALLNGND